MYRNCIFCSAALKSNQSLEAFPVGRRLAFDAERGRLWVVCARCDRWNLSPLEERWEAVEQAERLFRRTTLRIQGESLGLARLPEGTDLIRVGDALPGEMAAWRYGRTLQRRRWSHRLDRAADLAGGHALPLASTAFLLPAAVAALPFSAAMGVAVGLSLITSLPRQLISRRRGKRILLPATQAGSAQGAVPIRVIDAVGARLDVDETGDPIVEIEVAALNDFRRASRWMIGLEPMRSGRTIRGPAARNLLARLSVAANREGAAPLEVTRALRHIGIAGGSEAFLRQMAKEAWGVGGRRDSRTKHAPPFIPKLQSLAFEMALHEASERRALEGEVELLTAAWKEAEIIASISDSLLDVPSDDNSGPSSAAGRAGPYPPSPG